MILDSAVCNTVTDEAGLYFYWPPSWLNSLSVSPNRPRMIFTYCHRGENKSWNNTAKERESNGGGKEICTVPVDIRRYRKDPKKNVLQWGVQICKETRICKRTYRIWWIASSANTLEQSQILYVLYYVADVRIPTPRPCFDPSFARFCAVFSLKRQRLRTAPPR